MPENPILTFTLLLLALAAWMTIPLVPAFRELMSPRDAAPLEAVGNDAGNLTYFAESFTNRVTREGLLGTMVPPRLTDGTPVRAHTAAQPLVRQRAPIEEIVVFMDNEPVPDDITLASEALARLTLRSGRNVTFRALLGQRDVVLGENTTVLRWVHARGLLRVGDKSKLFGRATADREIILGDKVTFDRLEATVVRVSDTETPEPAAAPTSEYEVFQLPKDAIEMGPRYWKTERDLLIPPESALLGTAITTGSIIINSGARVAGSLKAHGEIIVRSGAIVQGSITAWDRIVIEAGARVSGPVISERLVEVQAAVIGAANRRTTITAPIVLLHPGATIYGAVMAGDEGRTVS
jgi:predicted acyltransferase (DUF342 family)